jgi:hypothetical protein
MLLLLLLLLLLQLSSALRLAGTTSIGGGALTAPQLTAAIALWSALLFRLDVLCVLLVAAVLLPSSSSSTSSHCCAHCCCCCGAAAALYGAAAAAAAIGADSLLAPLELTGLGSGQTELTLPRPPLGLLTTTSLTLLGEAGGSALASASDDSDGATFGLLLLPDAAAAGAAGAAVTAAGAAGVVGVCSRDCTPLGTALTLPPTLLDRPLPAVVVVGVLTADAAVAALAALAAAAAAAAGAGAKGGSVPLRELDSDEPVCSDDASDIAAASAIAACTTLLLAVMPGPEVRAVATAAVCAARACDSKRSAVVVYGQVLSKTLFAAPKHAQVDNGHSNSGFYSTQCMYVPRMHRSSNSSFTLVAKQYQQ